MGLYVSVIGIWNLRFVCYLVFEIWVFTAFHSRGSESSLAKLWRLMLVQSVFLISVHEKYRLLLN